MCAKNSLGPLSVAEAQRPNGRHRTRWTFVTALVATPLIVLAVWPQAFGLQTATFVTQVIAFRAPLAIGLGIAAAVLTLVALLAARALRTSAILMGVAAAMTVASIGNAGVLAARGFGGDTEDGEMTVVTWNTLGGGAPVDEIVRLVLETDADVVSLPETSAAAVAEAAAMLAAAGRPMLADTAEGSLPTSVLIAEHLGAYERDEEAGSTPRIPSGVWRSVDGSGPTIVAAHPVPPLLSTMPEWRDGLTWVTSFCAEPEVIIAGDFNATVDHLAWALGDCRDTATEVGAGAVGTWPISMPTWSATPIDHVLVGSGWLVDGVQVLTSFDNAGSDHRPVVATLTRE